jgi:hypothetical protein
MGVLPAAPDSISAALAAGHDVTLWPGGEIDSLRKWTDWLAAGAWRGCCSSTRSRG